MMNIIDKQYFKCYCLHFIISKPNIYRLLDTKVMRPSVFSAVVVKFIG